MQLLRASYADKAEVNAGRQRHVDATMGVGADFQSRAANASLIDRSVRRRRRLQGIIRERWAVGAPDCSVGPGSAYLRHSGFLEASVTSMEFCIESNANTFCWNTARDPLRPITALPLLIIHEKSEDVSDVGVGARGDGRRH